METSARINNIDNAQELLRRAARIIRFATKGTDLGEQGESLAELVDTTYTDCNELFHSADVGGIREI